MAFCNKEGEVDVCLFTADGHVDLDLDRVEESPAVAAEHVGAGVLRMVWQKT